jgi:hypothetical protein
MSYLHGCAHCGHARSSHGLSYVSAVGLHFWVAPSDAQVEQRMLLAAQPSAHTSDNNEPDKTMDLIEYARTSDLQSDPLVIDLCNEIASLREQVAALSST